MWYYTEMGVLLLIHTWPKYGYVQQRRRIRARRTLDGRKMTMLVGDSVFFFLA